MGADEGTKPSREAKGGLREETTINQSMRENAITKHIALYANFQNTSRTEDVAELVDVCLPCSSPWVLSTAQRKPGVVHAHNSSTGEMEAEIQDHPQLYAEFRVSLG